MGKETNITHKYPVDNNLVITMSAKKTGTKKKPKPKAKVKPITDEVEIAVIEAVEETIEEIATEPHPMDSECDFCKAPIYTGKAVKCECGVITHQFCFNSHGMTAHQPAHVIVKVVSASVYDESGAFKGTKATYEEIANV